MIKAEDFKQTWEDVAGLSPDDMEQWFRENIKDLPYMVAYLLTCADFVIKSDTRNVRELPACNFCGRVARFRGKTLDGKRHDMCEACFASLGQGLGSGTGYKLELVKL